MNIRFLVSILPLVMAIQFSEGQSLSPSKREAVLAQLNTLEEIVDGKQTGLRKTAVGVFQQASTSGRTAHDLYEKCQKALNPDKSDKEFREERERFEKRNGYSMRSSEAGKALQVQLQYLVISLKYAEGVELEILIPEIEKIVDSALANKEELGGAFKLLQTDLKRSVFAQVYELDDSLKLSEWCFTPGNYKEMYDQILFPYYRNNQRDLLPTVWDKRIKMEKFDTETRHKDNEEALLKFQTERYPALQWMKFVDLYKNGYEESAAAAMLNLIKSDPDSPQSSERIDKLRSLLNSEDDE